MKSAVLESTLDETREEFGMELDATRKKLEENIKTSETEVLRLVLIFLVVSNMCIQCAKRQEGIASLRASLQAAEDSATKQLQTKDKRIQSLEKKVNIHLHSTNLLHSCIMKQRVFCF